MVCKEICIIRMNGLPSQSNNVVISSFNCTDIPINCTCICRHTNENKDTTSL